ncbi:MAG TPA: hypothetical protein VGQ34_09460 [Sphingomicrobium sp.]|nr:hypothetical protein [Sphingomicrobium sp.]
MRDDPLERLRRDAGLAARADLTAFVGVLPDRGVQLEAIKAATSTHTLATDIAKAYGGVDEMMRRFAEQELQARSIIEAMGGLEAFRKTQEQHWAAALAVTEFSTVANLSTRFAGILPDLELAKRRALDLASIDIHSEILNGLNHTGLPDAVLKAFETTSLKMSVLAGIADVSGIATSSYEEAMRSLLGNWHTRPDLPRNFWTSRRVREGHYRRAEVDPGLIIAPPPATVEILVESGLAAGVADETGAVAFIEFGGVSVNIRSAEAEVDAYRAVRAFERRMRAFIAAKLETVAGPKWFKQRVSHEIFLKASEIRETALRSGEEQGPLINFTELGHLKEIVLCKNNWEQVFEAIFINRNRFEHDMLTLIALRRPIAHSRIIDSPQFLEALLVMKRLDDRMNDDGAWKTAAILDQ